MNAFVVIFTLLTAPTNGIAANTQVAFQPVASFEVSDTTEKKAMTKCTRYARAARTNGDFGTCVAKVVETSDASK